MFKGWWSDLMEIWNSLTMLGKFILFPVWLMLAILVLTIAVLVIVPYGAATKTLKGLKKLFFKAP